MIYQKIRETLTIYDLLVDKAKGLDRKLLDLVSKIKSKKVDDPDLKGLVDEYKVVLTLMNLYGLDINKYLHRLIGYYNLLILEKKDTKPIEDIEDRIKDLLIHDESVFSYRGGEITFKNFDVEKQLRERVANSNYDYKAIKQQLDNG